MQEELIEELIRLSNPKGALFREVRGVPCGWPGTCEFDGNFVVGCSPTEH